MSDVSGGELKFENDGELGEWLRTQPRETSIVIAARVALRVLPALHWRAERQEAQQFSRLVFASFWAAALARVAAKYPARALEFHVAADTAADAAHATADSVGAAAASAADAAVVDSAANADADAAADLWESVSADANRLRTVFPSELASEALWPQGRPDWAQLSWAALQVTLKEPHWEPWLDWYRRRLDVSEAAEDIEALFATLPLDPREKDPAEQNAALAAEIERLTKKPLSDAPTWAQESPHFDYGLFRGFFALTGGELRALRSHIEHGATSFSALRNPEPALQDSSYENCRREAPTSSCILVLEKMRG